MTACSVYEATAILFSPDEHVPDVVVVCAHGLDLSAVEFFTLVRSRVAGVEVYVYGEAADADVVSLALDAGADGEFTEAVWERCRNTAGGSDGVDSVGRVDEGNRDPIGGPVVEEASSYMPADEENEYRDSSSGYASHGQVEDFGGEQFDAAGAQEDISEADIRRDEELSRPVRVPWATGPASRGPVTGGDDSVVDENEVEEDGRPAMPLRIAPPAREYSRKDDLDGAGGSGANASGLGSTGSESSGRVDPEGATSAGGVGSSGVFGSSMREGKRQEVERRAGERESLEDVSDHAPGEPLLTKEEIDALLGDDDDLDRGSDAGGMPGGRAGERVWFRSEEDDLP